jgi:hypothetical protein
MKIRRISGGRSPCRARIDRRQAARSVRETNTVDSAAIQVLPDHHHAGMRPGAGRQQLLDDGDELAFGVPLAEIPQGLGHLRQPIATVDHRDDRSCLAEPNQRPQALRT